MGQPAIDLAMTLRSAAAETIENLAFTDLEARPVAEVAADAAGLHGARIDMGTMGRMDLILDGALLNGVAETLYSPPAGGLDPAMVGDTLKEILNIIAGRFLEALFQGKADFVLGLPELHLDVAEWNSHRVRALLADPDGGLLAVGLAPPEHAA